MPVALSKLHPRCRILLAQAVPIHKWRGRGEGGVVELYIQTYGFKSMFFNISVYLMDLLMDSCANGLPYGFAYGFWQNRFTL